MEYLMNYCYRLNLNVVYYLLTHMRYESEADGRNMIRRDKYNKTTLTYEQNGPCPTCKLKWTILFNIGRNAGQR